MPKKNYYLKLRLIIFFAISAVVLSTFYFTDFFEKWLNFNYTIDYSRAVVGAETRVHFIDVGQGDAILIELPDDKIFLIDSGTSKKSSIDKVLSTIKSVLKEKSVIDYFLLTHAHEDHVGGASRIFEEFQVQNFLRPNIYTSEEIDNLNLNESFVGVYNTEIYSEVINAMNKEENCNIFVVDRYFYTLNIFNSKLYSIEFLTPSLNKYENINNYSPIVKYTYGGRSFLLTGDAEREVEAEVLSKNKDILNCDILKAGHHGSRTSTTQEFLSAVSPVMAIISVGKGNEYNHPNADVYNRLCKEVGKNYVLRTDFTGNVVIGFKIQNVNELAQILVALEHYVPISGFYIKWWYIVIVGEGLLALFCFMPLKRTNKMINRLKYKNK